MKPNLDQQQLQIAMSRRIDEAVNDSDGGNNSFPFITPPDSPETLDQMGLNYIDNSDFDFSKDAYLNSTPAGGDVALECYNAFRQRFIRITDAAMTAGSKTLSSASGPFDASYTYPMDIFILKAGTDEKALVSTIVAPLDANTVELNDTAVFDITDGIAFFGETFAESSANAVKTSGHSLFAANEGANDIIARWDATAGQIELGSDGADRFDIALPLPLNIATRGLDFFFSVNVKLRDTATVTDPITLYCGLFDTTSGNAKFLEADNFTLSAAFVGTVGAVEYECVVVGTFNSGEQVVSDVVTVSNCAATFNDSNYIEWSWADAPNILDFSLYRRNTSTGVVTHVFTLYNGDKRFFDRNTSGIGTTESLPTAPARREYAYAESLPFIPTTTYARVPIRLRVPPTYDQASTTAKQVLRIGVHGVGDDPRPVVIDRVMLSLTESVWNRSQRDLERIQTTSPTATTPDGSQTGCFTGWNPVFVKKPEERNEKEWQWHKIPISEVRKGDYIYDGRYLNGMDRVLAVKVSKAKITYLVEMSNGIFFECTASERFISSIADRDGTRFDRFSLGDEISTKINGLSFQGKIESITEIVHDEPVDVYTLSLQGGKIFVVGEYRPSWWKTPFRAMKEAIKRCFGIITLAGGKAHNRKAGDYEIIV